MYNLDIGKIFRGEDMSFSKMSAIVFGIIFIIILYVIIYYSLKIMYKDMKGGGKRRPNNNSSARKRSFGIEVIEVSIEGDIKLGSVIPIKGNITLGRKDGNSIILLDQHVSGNHARFLIRNDSLFIEDLNSTNGTVVNGKLINGKVKLHPNDEIRIGTTAFKVLD